MTIISVASGKGGTGKTTVAVNLALLLAQFSQISLIDLDVEEPNDNLFLKCPMKHLKDVNVQRPVVDESSCVHCGLCAELCEFNALAVLPNQVMIFEELCHSCGLCSLVCPKKAITEKSHLLGIIKKSTDYHDNLTFFEGILKVGEALAKPIIQELKKIAFNLNDEHVILDLPPGSACPVIEALSGTDYAILVTEPTPAGEHDLIIAIQLTKQLNIPFGIVNNRSDVGDDRINRLTKENGYNLVLEIPHDEEIIHLYSNSLPLIGTKKYHNSFSQLWKRILEIKKCNLV